MPDTIIWEKWLDPFDIEEEIDVENLEEDNNVYDDYKPEYESKIKNIKCQLITTPFGLIPINENSTSGKIFNFWTGHTNFPLTVKVSEIIENTAGVETLNVFTKYRFRIAVGKAFKDSEVMRKINRNVYSYLKEKDVH